MGEEADVSLQNGLKPQFPQAANNKFPQLRFPINQGLGEGASRPFQIAHVPPSGIGRIRDVGRDLLLGVSEFPKDVLPHLFKPCCD